MWIRDINNYGCITSNGKIKNKGCFEVDKVIGSEPAYHKDNSFRIIPLALQEFFIKNIPIEITIRNHTNIYDFCGRQKFKGFDFGETHTLTDNQNIIEKQQKNCRYYISKPGSTFIKQYSKGSWEFIDKGYQVTIFNKFIDKPIKEYNVHYSYYIRKCQKEIDNIINNQLNLF